MYHNFTDKKINLSIDTFNLNVKNMHNLVGKSLIENLNLSGQKVNLIS